MLQLTPEAMDLVIAGFGDRPGIVYQSTASMAPTPSPRKWLRAIGHPWEAISLALFTAIHRITSDCDARYPCAHVSPTVTASDPAEMMLAAASGTSPDPRANDGIVPIRSQLWGTLVWAGLGDHLDVLGHYHDADQHEDNPELRHHDWLTSGSSFSHAQFDVLMDAIALGMLKASPGSGP
jgi:hypothetical protein